MNRNKLIDLVKAITLMAESDKRCNTYSMPKEIQDEPELAEVYENAYKTA